MMLSSMLWELLPTIILISEILKRKRCAIEMCAASSIVNTKEGKEGRGAPKAKLQSVEASTIANYPLCCVLQLIVVVFIDLCCAA